MIAFDGQAALVTGAARGIGRATALALARAGAAIAVNYRDDVDGALSVSEDIGRLGGRSIVVQADVADPIEASRLVDTTLSQLGGLDIVVNNAGVLSNQLIYDLAGDDWLPTMRTNFGGVVNVTRAALDQLMTTRQGTIVNVSSAVADRAVFGTSVYAASKAAINAFTRASALELGRFGIRVNAVAPGLVATQMTEDQLADARASRLRSRIPLRAFATEEDVADVIVLLASPAARYVTGAIVPVDGGLSLAIGLSTTGGRHRNLAK